MMCLLEKFRRRIPCSVEGIWIAGETSFNCRLLWGAWNGRSNIYWFIIFLIYLQSFEYTIRVILIFLISVPVDRTTYIHLNYLLLVLTLIDLFFSFLLTSNQQIRNMGYGGKTCLDSPSRKVDLHKPVGLYPCHRQGGHQVIYLTTVFRDFSFSDRDHRTWHVHRFAM